MRPWALGPLPCGGLWRLPAGWPHASWPPHRVPQAATGGAGPPNHTPIHPLTPTPTNTHTPLCRRHLCGHQEEQQRADAEAQRLCVVCRARAGRDHAAGRVWRGAALLPALPGGPRPLEAAPLLNARATTASGCQLQEAIRPGSLSITSRMCPFRARPIGPILAHTVQYCQPLTKPVHPGPPRMPKPFSPSQTPFSKAPPLSSAHLSASYLPCIASSSLLAASRARFPLLICGVRTCDAHVAGTRTAQWPQPRCPPLVLFHSSRFVPAACTATATPACACSRLARQR